METLSANEAKVHFGDTLLKAQRAPVQISKNGKPVAVIISTEEYENIEALKLRMLQEKARQAKANIATGNLTEGELFFDKLQSGKLD